MNLDTLRLDFEESAIEMSLDGRDEELIARIAAWRRYLYDLEWRPIMEAICAEMFDWDPSMAQLCGGYEFKISTAFRPIAEIESTLHMEYRVFEPSPVFLPRFTEVVFRTLAALNYAGRGAKLVGHWTSEDADPSHHEETHEWVIAIPRRVQPEDMTAPRLLNP